MKVKYIGPFEAVEIAGHPGAVEHGEEFDCADALGESLLQQVDNFAPIDRPAKAALKAFLAADEDEPAPIDDTEPPVDEPADDSEGA